MCMSVDVHMHVAVRECRCVCRFVYVCVQVCMYVYGITVPYDEMPACITPKLLIMLHTLT